MPRLTAVVPATNDPPTLAACLAAIQAAADPPEELVVVTEGGGAADARNAGARDASGDVLVFVDSDVLPHADAFTRIRRAFDGDPDLTALFGSYDDTPAAPGVVSTFRNLLHYYVHQEGAGAATTFWTGLGAVRRTDFIAVGGFDTDARYMEDVDLGIRLHRAGGRIVLDPAVQGTHLKHWTLRTMIWTDFAARGIPWVELLIRHGERSSALNLGWRHRMSAVASLLIPLGIVRRRPGLAASGALGLVLLNHPFYRFLARRRGTAEAAVGVGLHALHHIAGVAAVPAGSVTHLLRSRRSRSR